MTSKPAKNKEKKDLKKYHPKSSIEDGRRLTLEERNKCFGIIQEKMLRYGNINKMEIARELKISYATTLKLINQVNIDLQSVGSYRIEFKLIFERIKNRLFTLWDRLISEAEDGKLEIKKELMIMKEIKDTLDNFYKMLQEFGEAPKQAETINVNADITSRQLVINYNMPNGSEPTKQ